jgi:hypothetical protein
MKSKDQILLEAAVNKILLKEENFNPEEFLANHNKKVESGENILDAINDAYKSIVHISNNFFQIRPEELKQKNKFEEVLVAADGLNKVLKPLIKKIDELKSQRMDLFDDRPVTSGTTPVDDYRERGYSDD